MRISAGPLLPLLCLSQTLPYSPRANTFRHGHCFKMRTRDLGPKCLHVHCPRAITCGPRFTQAFP